MNLMHVKLSWCFNSLLLLVMSKIKFILDDLRYNVSLTYLLFLFLRLILDTQSQINRLVK